MGGDRISMDVSHWEKWESVLAIFIFISPGESPGRAIILPPAAVFAGASALAKSLTFKFFM